MTTLPDTDSPSEAGCESAEGECIRTSYTPTGFLTDPELILKRQLEIQQRELELFGLPPHVAAPGKGPVVDLSLDAEWTHNDVTRTNEIESIQCHVLGECGEFSHIEYIAERQHSDRPEFAKLIAKVLMLAIEDGAVLEWPSKVRVSAFFLRADLCAFRDLARFKTKLDSVGRSVGTRGPGIPFDVEFEPDDIERLTRQRQFPSFDGNRRRLLVVQMIDLVRHAPAGWRLDDIGKLLGQGKVKLPPGAITNMRQLRADDPDLYDAYARQDPLICAYFVSRLGDLLYTLFGSRNLPLTSSGVALKLFKKTLKENELDLHRVLGEVRQTATRYDEKRRGLRTSTEYVPVTMRSVHADFVVQTGHGGRGECMYVGPTPVGTYYDIDVASAYTTAMLALGLIDFDHPRVTLTRPGTGATSPASPWFASATTTPFAFRPCRCMGPTITSSSPRARLPAAPPQRRSRPR